MDWMKKFRMTIRSIQMADKNQSEKSKLIQKCPDMFINVAEQLKMPKEKYNNNLNLTWYNRKTKTSTPTRMCWRWIRKTDKLKFEKIKYLIRVKGVKAQEILAITFTKNAANEMIDRLIQEQDKSGLYQKKINDKLIKYQKIREITTALK